MLVRRHLQQVGAGQLFEERALPGQLPCQVPLLSTAGVRPVFFFLPVMCLIWLVMPLAEGRFWLGAAGPRGLALTTST